MLPKGAHIGARSPPLNVQQHETADYVRYRESLPPVVPNARSRGWLRTWDWLEQAVQRQGKAALVAAAAAWAGLPIAMWFVAIGAAMGAFAGIFGSSQIGLADAFPLEDATGIFGLGLGAAFGVLEGLLFVLEFYAEHPEQFIGEIFTGLVVAVLALAVLVVFEHRLFRLRGYRTLSRREKEYLYPLLQETGRRMGLPVVPALWISDSEKPSAWTHMRAIVVTRGLLGNYDASEGSPRPHLDDDALGAILAHELHHWQVGDPVGVSMVWSCFWPIVVLFNAATALRRRAGVLGSFGWLLLWPTWVTTKLIVVPMMMKRCRDHEYEADARVASLGDDYRLGLRRALNSLTEWEEPRTGWEDALAATHPPLELRLEQLEAPREQESEAMSPAPVPVEPTPAEAPSTPPRVDLPRPAPRPSMPTPAPAISQDNPSQSDY